MYAALGTQASCLTACAALSATSVGSLFDCLVCVIQFRSLCDRSCDQAREKMECSFIFLLQIWVLVTDTFKLKTGNKLRLSISSVLCEARRCFYLSVHPTGFFFSCFSGCPNAILHGICGPSDFLMLDSSLCRLSSLPNVCHCRSCHNCHVCILWYLYEQRSTWNEEIRKQNQKSSDYWYYFDLARNSSHSWIWKTISFSEKVSVITDLILISAFR